MSGQPEQRICQHRAGWCEGFTKRYGVKRLVWCEYYTDASAAIRREKQLKEWQRAWKSRLIEESNPEWSELWWRLTGQRE
jgi:putative endonuclease